MAVKKTIVFLFAGILIIIIGWILNARHQFWGLQVKDFESQMQLQSKQWPLYKSTTLGVSFRYPRLIDQGELVFFQAGDVVFVTRASASLYAHRNELFSKSDSAILEKAKSIEDQDTSFPKGSWKVWVRDARSDEDLNQIVKDTFGDGCKVGEKVMSSQPGTYDVSIDPVKPGVESKSDPDSSCFINTRISFKFSPRFQRAALWNLGQEGAFLLNNCSDVNYCDADQYMAQSFTFIPRSR